MCSLFYSSLQAVKVIRELQYRDFFEGEGKGLNSLSLTPSLALPFAHAIDHTFYSPQSFLVPSLLASNPCLITVVVELH